MISFVEDADYLPHKEDEDEWWNMAYFVCLNGIFDEEQEMVQIDEQRYQEMTAKFFDAVKHAVKAMTFEEVFGNRF